MTALPYILLYVENPHQSATFYSALLASQPVEASDTFALFVLDNGVKLGLWARAGVQPAATMTGGGSEYAISVADETALLQTLADWQAAGATLEQPVTAMDFGLTFTVSDPDGHRLRAFVPAPHPMPEA